jgi:RNAse (barnase) inhibitor barstar
MLSITFAPTPGPMPDVTIPGDCRTMKDVHERLSVGLRFPSYYGHNLDALVDCLSDMSWWAAPMARVVHTSISQFDASELAGYVAALGDVQRRTRSHGGSPLLIFEFSEPDRRLLEPYLLASGFEQ